MKTDIKREKQIDGSPLTVLETRVDGVSREWSADGNFTEMEMMQKFYPEIQIWLSERILTMLHDVAFRLQMGAK